MDDLPPDSLDTPAAILPPDDFGFVFSVKKNYVLPPFPPSNEIAWVNKPGTHGFYPVADEDAWKRVCTKLDLRDCRVRLQRSKRCDQLAVAFKEEQARMRRESVKAAVYGLGAPPPVALKSPFQIISQQNSFIQAGGNSRVPDAAHSQQFNFAPMLAYPAKRNFATPAPSIPAPPAAKRPRAMKMYRTEEGVWLKDCVVKAHDCLRDFPPEFAERLRSGRGSLRYHPYRRVTPDGGFVGDVYVDYTGRAHNDLNFSWMGRSVALEDRDAVEESKVSSTWLVPVIQMTPSDIPAVIAPALPSMLQAGVGGPVAVPAWQTNGAGVTMSLRPTNPLPMSMSMSLPMPMQPQLQPRLIISGGPRPRAQGIRVRQMAPYNESNVMVLPPVSNRPLFDHGYSGRPRNPGPPRAARAPMRPMRPSLAMTQRPATTTKWFADPLAPSAVPPPLRNPSAVTRPRPPLTAALVAALRPNGHHASNGHHIPPPAAQGSSGPSSSSSMEATQRGKISIIPINRMLDGAAVLPPPPSVPRPAKVVMQALDGDAAFQADDTEDDPLNAAGSKAAAVVDPLNSVSVAPPEDLRNGGAKMSDVPCKRYASRHSRSARLLRDGAPNHVRDAIARGRLEYEETVGAVRLHKSQANLNVELRSSAESTCPLRRSRSDSDVNKRSSSPSRLQFQLEVERRVRGELEREKEALFRTNLDLSGEVERTRGICDDLRFKLELAKNRNPSTECDATKHFLSQTSSTIELPRLFPLHEEIPPMNAIDKVEWWRNKDDDNRTTTTKRDSGCQMSERSAVTLPPVASRRLLLRASSSTLNKASSCSPSPPPLPLPPPPPPSSSPPHAAPLALHPAPSSPSPARVVTTKAKTKRDGGGTRPVSAAASASPSSSSSSSLPRRTDGRIGEEETALADGELIDVVVDRVLRRLGSSGGGDPGSGSGGRRLSTLADAAVQAQTGFTTPAPRTPELAVVRARPKRFSRGKPGRPSPRDHIYRKLDVGSDDETTTTMAAVVVGSPSANAPRLLEYVQQCNVIAAQLNRESRQILAALERGTEGL